MIKTIFFSLLATLSITGALSAQKTDPVEKQRIRTVSIPISIFTKEELRQRQAEEFIQADRLIVKEDREEQTILSIRSVVDAPLALAILIQDDLSASFNLQIKDLKKFIRSLPRGSRVMVAYMRGGTLQIRQRFTDDLDHAAESLRIVASSPAVAPRSPFDSVVDALDRFDALPAGRRAILLISDGLDSTAGIGSSSPSESIDLERSITRAQRRSVAVFSIYNPASLTDKGSGRFIINGQG
jgi:hypothetical protein